MRQMNVHEIKSVLDELTRQNVIERWSHETVFAEGEQRVTIYSVWLIGAAEFTHLSTSDVAAFVLGITIGRRHELRAQHDAHDRARRLPPGGD